MSETTEMLKVHGFTQLDETNGSAAGEWIRDVNAVLPGSMFLVYDARQDNPGYWVVEYAELVSYTEA